MGWTVWGSNPSGGREEAEERVEQYLYSPSVPSRHVLGLNLTFTF